MKRSVFPGLAVALLLPALAEGQDTEWNRYTLEDLGGVHVRFEIDDVCQGAGITAALYEADASLKLIESEVGVLTMQEMLANPAMPELRIDVACAEGSESASGAMAWSVALRVQQSAQMLRDTQITLPEAVTWFHGELGATSAGGAADAVGSAVMRQIDLFAAAWAAAHATDAGGADR